MQHSYARPRAICLLALVSSLSMLAWAACGPASRPADPAPATTWQDPPTKATETTAGSAPAGTGAAATATPASAPAKLTPEQKKRTAAELRSKLRAHLAAGRSLVKQKKYQDALVELEQARLIKPNHPRVLSEIGWAAMQVGDLKRAERANLDSVRFAQDNEVKGASLYNLGRIAEAQSKMQKAAEYYVQSLAVRKNALVDRRLRELEKAGVYVDRSLERECPFTRLQASGDLCTAAVQALRAAAPDDFPSPVCDDTRLDRPVHDELDIDHKALDKAVLFSIFERDGTSDFIFLGVRYQGAWYVSPLAYVYNPGAFGIFEDITVEQFDAEQLVPGGPPEIRVRLQKDRNDTDPGMDEEEGVEESVVHVVGVVRGEVKHLMALVESYSYSRERMYLDDYDGDDGDDSEDDSEDAGRAVLRSEKNGVDYRFEPARGQVIIEALDDIPASQAPGTYKLTTYPEPCPRIY